MTAETAVAETVAAMQARLDSMQARLANLESRPAPSAVPFEAAVYGWVRRLAMIVADEWGVSGAELIGHGRAGVLIKPRFVLIWLVRTAGKQSLPQIARLMNGRDHTTIMYALRRVEEWRAADEVIRHSTDTLLQIAIRLRAEQYQLGKTMVEAADEALARHSAAPSTGGAA